MSWKARLSQSVREVRLVFCPRAVESAGARLFVAKNFGPLQQLNPMLPLLVREGEGVAPTLSVRYDFDVREEVPLAGLGEQDVLAALRELAAKGDTMARSPESAPYDRDLITSKDIRLNQLY